MGQKGRSLPCAVPSGAFTVPTVSRPPGPPAGQSTGNPSDEQCHATTHPPRWLQLHRALMFIRLWVDYQEDFDINLARCQNETLPCVIQQNHGTQ